MSDGGLGSWWSQVSGGSPVLRGWTAREGSHAQFLRTGARPGSRSSIPVPSISVPSHRAVGAAWGHLQGRAFVVG